MKPVLTASEWYELPPDFEAVVPTDWIDQMGHMNVMWYTHLFSQGLFGFFQKIGMTKSYFENEHSGSFMLEQHIRYWSEVRLGERVSIRLRMIARNEKRLHLLGLLIKEDLQVLASTMECITSHIDLSLRRSSPFPPKIAKSIDDLLAHHQNLSWPAPTNGVISITK